MTRLPRQGPSAPGSPPAASWRRPAPAGGGAVKVVSVVGLLFVFLVGVKGLGDGFELLGADLLDAFFSATSNPLVALFIGVLGTTLVQSSSVTTSMIVGLVAAPANPLPLSNAIPMIMGANMGTTVTNSLVSIGHIGRPDEFRRAFAVATCHDFFNFVVVAILLPLELATGVLRQAAVGLARLLEGATGYTYSSPLDAPLSSALALIGALIEHAVSGDAARAAATIGVSAALIFFALYLLVRVMRSAMQSRVERFITGVLGSSAVLSMAVGAIATVMVQSSSITTSLLVPLAGASIITLGQAFPITIGANIGTTVTALLAALAGTGPNAIAGLQIALVHLLFNLAGTILVYPAPAMRRLPLRAAQALAGAAIRSRAWALAYVAGLFYGVPALLMVLDRWLF